jgi:hypothetical protein
MNSIKKQARVAGLLYFLASLPAPFGLIYVPTKLIVLNDATATANNIRASESLLRLGIGCELLGSIMFILVVVALYCLFKPHDDDPNPNFHSNFSFERGERSRCVTRRQRRQFSVGL